MLLGPGACLGMAGSFFLGRSHARTVTCDPKLQSEVAHVNRAPAVAHSLGWQLLAIEET